MSLSIVIPTKNEAMRLDDLLLALKTSLPDARILIVDTPGSNPDNTRQISESYGAAYVSNPQGFGKCLTQGLSLESKHSDYVITMDADHDPESAKLLYKTLRDNSDYGLSIGSEQGTRITRTVTNFLLHTFLPFSQAHPTCGLRCYRSSALPSILPYAHDEWFFIQLELLYGTIKSGYKTVEVPFPTRDHAGSTSKPKFFFYWLLGFTKLFFTNILGV